MRSEKRRRGKIKVVKEKPRLLIFVSSTCVLFFFFFFLVFFGFFGGDLRNCGTRLLLQQLEFLYFLLFVVLMCNHAPYRLVYFYTLLNNKSCDA